MPNSNANAFAGLRQGLGLAVVVAMVGCATVPRAPQSSLAEAEIHLGKAQTLETNPNRIAEAEAEYRQALRLNPGSAAAHNGLGALWYNYKLRPDADIIREFEAATAGDPTIAASAHRNLGLIFSRDPKRRDDALVEFHLAVVIMPGYTEGWKSLGDFLASQRDTHVEAVAAYQRAIELAPQQAELYFNLGVVYSNMPDKTGEAIQAYFTSIRLDPKDPRPRNNLGILLQRQNGRSADATAVLLDTVALAPGDARYWANLSSALRDNEEYDTAIGAADQAIALQPDFAFAYHCRGMARLKKGDWDGALADLQQQAKLDPTLASDRFPFAWIAYEKEDWDTAIGEFGRVLEETPGHIKALSMRARCLQLKGSLPEALVDISRAIDLAPANAYLRDARADILAKLERPTEALADLDVAVELAPTDSFFRYNRGKAQLELKNADGALADFDLVVSVDPRDEWVWSLRAEAWELKEDYRKAIDDISRAIAINPSYFHWRDRGRFWLKAGNPRAAVRDFDEALRLEPDNDLTLSYRADAKLMVPDIAGALADYDAAVDLEPADDMHRRIRGKARLNTGDFTGALDDFERAYALAGSKQPWVAFWRFLLLKRLQQPTDAGQVKAVAQASGEAWLQTIASFLAGDIDETVLLARAVVGPADKLLGQQCEVFYYAGMVRLLDGDLTGARGLFEQSIATKRTNFVEYDMARAELARMGSR